MDVGLPLSIEWYPHSIDVILMMEGLVLPVKWSWSNLAPSWLPRLILPFLNSINFLEEEPNGWVGRRYIITKMLHLKVVGQSTSIVILAPSACRSVGILVAIGTMSITIYGYLVALEMAVGLRSK